MPFVTKLVFQRALPKNLTKNSKILAFLSSSKYQFWLEIHGHSLMEAQEDLGNEDGFGGDREQEEEEQPRRFGRRWVTTG